MNGTLQTVLTNAVKHKLFGGREDVHAEFAHHVKHTKGFAEAAKQEHDRLHTFATSYGGGIAELSKRDYAASQNLSFLREAFARVEATRKREAPDGGGGGGVD